MKPRLLKYPLSEKDERVYNLVLRDLPKDVRESIKPNQIFISPDKKEMFLDITIQTFFESYFRRYDPKNKKLIFGDIDYSVGWSDKPGTDGFYGGILGEYEFTFRPYVDSMMKKLRPKEMVSQTSEEIFGDC